MTVRVETVGPLTIFRIGNGEQLPFVVLDGDGELVMQAATIERARHEAEYMARTWSFPPADETGNVGRRAIDRMAVALED